MHKMNNEAHGDSSWVDIAIVDIGLMLGLRLGLGGKTQRCALLHFFGAC